MSNSLGDLISAILAQVTHSRVQADIESLKIAQVYDSDSMLKHFPVPRMRLPKVEVDVPVIIDGIKDNSTDGENLLTDKEMESLAVSIVDLFHQELNKINEDVKVNEDEKKRLAEIAYKEINGYLPNLDLLTAKKLASILFSSIFNNHPRKDFLLQLKDDQKSDFEKKFSDRALTLIIWQISKTAKLLINPKTGSVREIADNQLLFRFKLSITEDAMEWSSGTDENDNQIKFLTPE